MVEFLVLLLRICGVHGMRFHRSFNYFRKFQYENLVFCFRCTSHAGMTKGHAADEGLKQSKRRRY